MHRDKLQDSQGLHRGTLCNKSKLMNKNGGGTGELTAQLRALTALAGD